MSQEGRVWLVKRIGLRWYRGVETGSAGIESKLSVFIQPTLQSLIKKQKKTLSEKVSFLPAF